MQDTSTGATPLKDLIGAAIVGALGVAAMSLSVVLENPERLLTAPGLLPFITGLALLLMAIALGSQAVRGGAARGFFAALGVAARDAWSSAEDRRAALLGGLVCVYVLLVAQLAFELVSIVVVAAILKLFWRASVLRCVVVAVLAVEALALSFRYGFNLIMPGAF